MAVPSHRRARSS